MKNNSLRRVGYTLFGIFVIVISPIFLNGAASTQTATTIGRYQLFAGEVTVSRQPPEKISVIFKIDTQTGETWGYDITRGVWRSNNDIIKSSKYPDK
jgi:hypothetical protein